jgi:hypothetical protein
MALKPACCLNNCDRGKKSSFSTVSAMSGHSTATQRVADFDPLRKFGSSDHDGAFVGFTSALGFLRWTISDQRRLLMPSTAKHIGRLMMLL